MRGLYHKVPDPLKVQHRLECIAADANYLNIYSHIMCNTGKKIAICLLQNASPNFPMFCKTYARENKKQI